MPSSSKTPNKQTEYPTTQYGTSENGRGARKSNAVNSQRANKPGKLRQKEVSNQKRNFTP